MYRATESWGCEVRVRAAFCQLHWWTRPSARTRSGVFVEVRQCRVLVVRWRFCKDVCWQDGPLQIQTHTQINHDTVITTTKNKQLSSTISRTNKQTNKQNKTTHKQNKQNKQKQTQNKQQTTQTNKTTNNKQNRWNKQQKQQTTNNNKQNAWECCSTRSLSLLSIFLIEGNWQWRHTFFACEGIWFEGKRKGCAVLDLSRVFSRFRGPSGDCLYDEDIVGGQEEKEHCFRTSACGLAFVEHCTPSAVFRHFEPFFPQRSVKNCVWGLCRFLELGRTTCVGAEQKVVKMVTEAEGTHG